MNQAQDILITRLDLSQTVVDQAFDKVAHTALGEMMAIELEFLKPRDPEGALANLLNTAEDSANGIDNKRSSVAGILAGLFVVRKAAEKAGLILPSYKTETIAAFDAYVTVNPAWLDDRFYDDYNRFPAVLKLVNSTLKQPNAQARAKEIFAIHGLLANPDRPEYEIPIVSPLPQQRQAPKASPERKRMLKKVNSASQRFN